MDIQVRRIDRRLKQLEDIISDAGLFVGWIHLGSEGDQFVLRPGTRVRYGVPGHWVEQIVGPDGQAAAVNGRFGGDPMPGVPKEIERYMGPPPAIPPIPPAPAAVNVNIPPNVPPAPPQGGTRRRKRTRKLHRKTISK